MSDWKQKPAEEIVERAYDIKYDRHETGVALAREIISKHAPKLDGAKPKLRRVRVEELPMPCFVSHHSHRTPIGGYSSVIGIDTTLDVAEGGRIWMMDQYGACISRETPASLINAKYSADGKEWKSFEVEV